MKFIIPSVRPMQSPRSPSSSTTFAGHGVHTKPPSSTSDSSRLKTRTFENQLRSDMHFPSRRTEGPGKSGRMVQMRFACLRETCEAGVTLLWCPLFSW